MSHSPPRPSIAVSTRVGPTPPNAAAPPTELCNQNMFSLLDRRFNSPPVIIEGPAATAPFSGRVIWYTKKTIKAIAIVTQLSLHALNVSITHAFNYISARFIIFALFC
jgi:hypothetical protein